MNEDKGKVLEVFWPRLARVASTYEVLPQLQQELVQEMALAIWLSLSHFRGESSMDTFCYRIAHNVGVGHVKKQVKKIRTCNEDYDFSATAALEQGVAQDQQLNILMNAIRQLPLVQRQIITLYLDGVKQQDIAEILGMSESNIAVRVNRAKLSLAQLMSQK